MIAFISGGCKNGKSSYAERLSVAAAETAPPLYYLATMKPSDNEDLERIERHRQSRAGLGFETVESPKNIRSVLRRCDNRGTFLLDSLTALLANEMFTGDSVNMSSAELIVADLIEIFNRVQNIVIVSDFIYSDAARYDKLTEAYRRNLAELDRFAARRADIVIEACSGCFIYHKGAEHEILKKTI